MTAFNDDYQITRGELTTQQKQKFDESIRTRDRYQATIQQLCDHLDFEPPKRDDGAAEATEEGVTAILASHLMAKDALMSDLDWLKSPWEDEESKNFYTSLTDLSIYVPQAYFQKEEKKKKVKVAPLPGHSNTRFPPPI